MKKIVCFVLALTLVLGVASMALAAGVSASYSDGVLTVSASIASDYKGAYSVLVDGNDTGRSLTAASNTVSISKTYAAGSHTVSVENDVIGVLGTASFTVPGSAEPTTAPTTAPTTEPTVAPTTAPTTEPTKAPTAAPTTEPTVAPSDAPETPAAIGAVKYQNGVVTFTVSGLNKNAEVWLDGSSTGMSIPGSGTFTLNVRLKYGSHTLSIFNPTLTTNPSKTFEAAVAQPTISGSYTKVGALVVTVSGLNNPSEVWLDGAASSLAVNTDGSYTLGIELKEGTHKLMLFDQLNNIKAYADVTVDHIWKVSPAAVAPTCTTAGSTEGVVCEICGKVEVAPEVVPALGHNYAIVERTLTRVYYKCTRCGDSFFDANDKAMKNAYGDIVFDANMVGVDYTAKVEKNVLTITADLTSKANLTSELGLYLSDELIAKLKKDGVTTVNFINGTATIAIDLNAVKADWFAEGTTIWNYVFSTDPAAEGGTLVKVEAQVSGTEKVPADAFTGVTLKKADGDVAVTANGIY